MWTFFLAKPAWHSQISSLCLYLSPFQLWLGPAIPEIHPCRPVDLLPRKSIKFHLSWLIEGFVLDFFVDCYIRRRVVIVLAQSNMFRIPLDLCQVYLGEGWEGSRGDNWEGRLDTKEEILLIKHSSKTEMKGGYKFQKVDNIDSYHID